MAQKPKLKPVKSTWLPNVRLSPERLTRYIEAAEAARQADPELDFSAWVRRALDREVSRTKPGR